MTRVAVTGANGFVGRHLVAHLTAGGHEVVRLGRPSGQPMEPAVGVDIDDAGALAAAIEGCETLVLLAGINRERGRDTYFRVHVDATMAAIEAAHRAGVEHLVLLSFLRARASGPSEYHRSKWTAERLVRTSGLAYTVLKSGVIFGRGDHMLDHIARAVETFPFFGLVGSAERPIRPVAVADVVRLLAAAALGGPRLRNQTLAVLGPEELSLAAAVRRVATERGRRPLYVPLPVAFHRLLAVGWEAAMSVPLVSRAQVEILAEGIAEPLDDSAAPPADLLPSTAFTRDVIRAGLPPPGGFGRRDLRCSTVRPRTDEGAPL